jgi:hypothetical protein
VALFITNGEREWVGGGSGRRSKEEGAPTDQVHGRVVNEGGEGRCDGRHRLRTAEGG